MHLMREGSVLGKINEGGSHKPPYFVARDTVANARQQRGKFAPGARVIVRSIPGVPNPYDGRSGEVVASNDVDGLSAYTVRLDVYLRDEPVGTPVEFFADELRAAR